MHIDDLADLDEASCRDVCFHSLLFAERDWLFRVAIGQLADSRYAQFTAEDVASELICAINNPAERMAYVADSDPAARPRIMRSYLIQVMRTQWSRIAHSRYCSVGDSLDEHTASSDSGAAYLMGSSPSPEDEMVFEEDDAAEYRYREAAVESLRGHLAQRQYEVFRMLVVEGLDARTAAAEIGCGPSNVHSVRRKGRARLVSLFGLDPV